MTTSNSTNVKARPRLGFERLLDAERTLMYLRLNGTLEKDNTFRPPEKSFPPCVPPPVRRACSGASAERRHIFSTRPRSPSRPPRNVLRRSTFDVRLSEPHRMREQCQDPPLPITPPQILPHKNRLYDFKSVIRWQQGAGMKAMGQRENEMTKRNTHPEFHVPVCAGLYQPSTSLLLSPVSPLFCRFLTHKTPVICRFLMIFDDF